jgi:hypothetical protein
MKYIIIIFLSIFVFSTSAWAQIKEIPEQKEKTQKQEEVEDNLPADPPSKFDLVFNRSFMLNGGGTLDTVPINGSSSGTFSIGGGIKFPLAQNKLGIRVTPSVAWTQINYNQTDLKSFPTVKDSLPFDLTSERHGLFHVELPIGVYVNVSRDEDNDPKFFVEAGGYIGYLISAKYQYRYLNSSGQRIRVQNRDLETIENEFEKLRYGIYARLGYKWAALYFNVRISDVFDEFANDPPREVLGGFKNPIIPAMQAGITIFL